MLLRLRIQGFKNLKDTEIRFGPLTCFVGRNGVGKSNIFDAIQFLRLLSEREIQDAAAEVRSPLSGGYGPLDLFRGSRGSSPIHLEADMVVPLDVLDDFGESARPSSNFLRYAVSFRSTTEPRPRLELVEEELAPLPSKDLREILGFHHSAAFRRSLVSTGRRKGKFISTERTDSDQVQIRLHQDGGSRGRPVSPGRSPRTVLGGTNTREYPTVLAARREMETWHSLHLEPSSLRTPDSLNTEGPVTEHGAGVAATLRRLQQSEGTGRVLAEAANRLSRLVPEVERLVIDQDETRQQLTVRAQIRGTAQTFGPRALSDGTLRFLALVTMQMDTRGSRVLCLEEPENGIHPSRIPCMVQLLRDYSLDPELPVGEDNPARQVVINSHSPEVLKQTRVEEVLFVESSADPDGPSAIVASIEGSWRKNGPRVTSRHLAAILGGAPLDAALKRQLALPFAVAEERA
ncbi:MAG: AAA family ATPase [Planctomycetes bacterium]|jgi:predicted ATPase|nr:AAA family ATPase [Planctomycetota bacterium]